MHHQNNHQPRRTPYRSRSVDALKLKQAVNITVVAASAGAAVTSRRPVTNTNISVRRYTVHTYQPMMRGTMAASAFRWWYEGTCA